ncbi:hypothetical protein [Bordetella genomosp. 11]|uniref:hypothetical protein n=1 Tax=Bordetella genomosp. 11 TaxID=1416808 RepID=UPI00113FFF77|nr:hypothetical protein [Bordetella genomosp. 11]
MNISTRAQKIGLEALKNNARRQIFITLSALSLNKPLIAELRGFYGVRTTKAAIEHAISNAAARLARTDRDLLENAILDKLEFVKQLQSSDAHERLPSHSGKVKVKAMNWEIIIIASQAPMSFDNSEALVDFCLEYASEQMKTLFGDV